MIKFSIQLLFLLTTLTGLVGGSTLDLSFTHRYEGQLLRLGGIRYGKAQPHSVTRLSYLLSDFALQKQDGSWVSVAEQYLWIDLGARRTHGMLNDLPSGTYRAIRFSLGVPKAQNHGDPAQWPAEHALNPNLNQLHWNWSGGYIFLALEGLYRGDDQQLKGFVYHLANDDNLTKIEIPAKFELRQAARLDLGFDLARLLAGTRPLDFVKDGDSSHSAPGDPIASALCANLTGSFSLEAIKYPQGEAPLAPVKPLYLPETFTPYRFTMSARFPRPQLPRDNPLLEERVALGKQLFFDPRLSSNKQISCASCHQADKVFSDPRPLSRGVEDRLGARHSMPLFNLAWKSSFFWDGRAASLREQVLQPIQDHQEMASDLPSLLNDINADQDYSRAFDKAFGEGPATSEKLALALENYLLTLTSYDSKFDRAMAGKVELNELESRGMELFFTEYEPRSGKRGADCFHCHGGANFSDHRFHNNGLAPDSDLGRFAATRQEVDKYLFSTPSLRNVAQSAPYMHDGRFATLEQVIAHYSGPMHRSETLDPNLAKHPKAGLKLTQGEQAALVAFLKTLSDPKFGTSLGEHGEK